MAPNPTGGPKAAPRDDGSRRRWIYALDVQGRYQTVHRWTGRALQLFLVSVPWFLVAGRPAVQFDLVARRLYLLGGIYTAQDSIFLVFAGLGAAFSLFLFTALYGRLWCGYACPQTVFLEEWIRPIEAMVEGPRGVRMARDRGPWTAGRAGRKALKWSLFAVIAGGVAMAFTSWFVPARTLWLGLADPAAYGFVAVLAALLFWDFAWFREQFCNYLCPYARFQGALTDDQSLVVAYNAGLGEPRGKARGDNTRRATRQNAADAQSSGIAVLRVGESQPLGACIDCKKCVAVCPQGVDIREGFQLECINCARCVDACDDVFAKLRDKDSSGEPTPGGVPQKSNAGLGLIQYTSLSRASLLRPRTIAYGALLAAIFTALLVLGFGHHDLRANLARAPGTLYVVDADGWTRNTYLLQVTNNSADPAPIAVTVEGLPEGSRVDVTPVTVAPAATVTVPMIVRVAPDPTASRTLPLTVTVASHPAEGGHADSVAIAATFKSASATGGGG